jgi:hypothetical protein
LHVHGQTDIFSRIANKIVRFIKNQHWRVVCVCKY